MILDEEICMVSPDLPPVESCFSPSPAWPKRLIPIRHKKHDIADGCHCEGIKPETISVVIDCFPAGSGTSLLAMTAHVISVKKVMKNWYYAIMTCERNNKGTDLTKAKLVVKGGS
jgi:hypothetical protein